MVTQSNKFANYKKTSKLIRTLRKITLLVAVIIELVLLVSIINNLISQNWINLGAQTALSIELLILGLGYYQIYISEAGKVFCSSEEEINQFIMSFVEQGTTIDIVSRRLAWVEKDIEVYRYFENRIIKGAELNLHVQKVLESTSKLDEIGAKVFLHPQTMTKYPRFTLINADRPGGARLAIGSGVIPEFYVTVYDDKHHQQILSTAMALVDSIKSFKGDHEC